MTQLSKNLRTHVVYVKTLDGRDTEEIQITKAQYDIISDDIRNLKTNDFYTISDIDTWKTLFEGQKKDIVRFKEKNLSTNSNYTAICHLGERHQVINWKVECNCLKKMWIEQIEVMPSFHLLWYNISNSTEITKEMRQELFKKINSDPNFKKEIMVKFKEMQKDWLLHKQEEDKLYWINLKYNF